jgi:hypothetical protein
MSLSWLQYLVASSPAASGPAASTLSTLRALAETADELYDLHLPTVGQVIACLISSQDEPVLAAVSGGQKSGGQQSGGQRSGGQHFEQFEGSDREG